MVLEVRNLTALRVLTITGVYETILTLRFATDLAQILTTGVTLDQKMLVPSLPSPSLSSFFPTFLSVSFSLPLPSLSFHLPLPLPFLSLSLPSPFPFLSSQIHLGVLEEHLSSPSGVWSKAPAGIVIGYLLVKYGI